MYGGRSPLIIMTLMEAVFSGVYNNHMAALRIYSFAFRLVVTNNESPVKFRAEVAHIQTSAFL